jgi:hypothetical protein
VRYVTVTLAAGLLLLALPVCASACASDPKAAFERFIGAFNALDWESFRDCLADSVSLFNPDIPAAVSLHRLDGRTQVERSFRAVFDAAREAGAGGPQIVPERVRVERYGEAAIVSFEFRRSAHSFGRRTIAFAREHGDWRITHIHASNVTH